MTFIHFDPFPVLRTPHLLLRQLHQADQNEIFRLRSDENLMRYIPRPVMESAEEAVSLIETINREIAQKTSIVWGITEKENSSVIGTIGYRVIYPEHYRAEIGYMMHGDYHGKGYMPQALQAVMNYGFEVMQLHSIEAIVCAENIASAKLLEKNQFVREGYFRENQFFHGRFHDSVSYARHRHGEVVGQRPTTDDRILTAKGCN